jgi:hypothetical protein
VILPADIEAANRELLGGPQLSRPRGNPQPSAKPAATQAPAAQPAKRAPITIVCHAGRWLDVYSEDVLDVELINLPALPGSEAALEQFAEAVLPRRHARQLWPGWIRYRGEIEALTAAEIARRVSRAELIGSLRSAGALYTGAELLRIATGGRAR